MLLSTPTWTWTLTLSNNVMEDKECGCVYVREREGENRDTENTQDLEMYIHKGERLNSLQGGRRVLYIVTLSLH